MTKARVVFGIDRALVALVFLYRSVGVQPHEQCVTLIARKREIGDVAPVQDVETAIGENELFTRRMKIVAVRAGLFHRHDFGFGIQHKSGDDSGWDKHQAFALTPSRARI